jgi:parvulin-like peptidyl-prolyl isomerase
VAKVGNTFVSYEDYLFELRHYIHYFENQQDVDFDSEQGKAQLAEQRKKSLDKVVKDAYVAKVARQNNITVSEEEVDQQIEILKSQNRLGTDNQVFEDVLQDYWGWSIADFRRSIKAELFANKVSRELDTETKSEAEAALAELDAGKKFADVAKKYSEDETTKANGGELGFEVKKTDRNIPVQTVNALFAQKPGEYSEIINIGYGLEIVKTISIEEGKVTGARIFFAYKDIDEFLNDIKAEQPTTSYIKVEQ